MANARNHSATARQLEINTFGYAVTVRAFLQTGEPQTRQGAVADAANVETALQRIPTPNSDSLAFGCLYVMEGATLGGQVIGRHVRQTLGVTPETGGRFHAAYGDRTEAQRNKTHG